MTKLYDPPKRLRRPLIDKASSLPPVSKMCGRSTRSSTRVPTSSAVDMLKAMTHGVNDKPVSCDPCDKKPAVECGRITCASTLVHPAGSAGSPTMFPCSRDSNTRPACASCGVLVSQTQEAVECGMCRLYVHISCDHLLTPTSVAMINDVSNPAICYQCLVCRIRTPDHHSSSENITI